jgi:hypothetical protein
VHDIVLDERRMKVREIAEIIGISKERAGYMLHEEFDTKTLFARWVPFLLTADQKRICMKVSEQCLKHRFITMDETWIYRYTPESKQQSKQWTEASCSASEKAKSVPSAGKVMTLVFWDAEGIFLLIILKRVKL